VAAPTANYLNIVAFPVKSRTINVA